MRMDSTDCLMYLGSASFGVLGTVDLHHGTHLVPVVFAFRDDELVIPIDSVKPKGKNRLRRVDNLRADSRASFLVDHRDTDWGELWWVRVDLEFNGNAEPEASWRSALASKYPQYRPEQTIDALLLFTICAMRGWRAT
jgi:PPOX class probable F420-dependent enzyme